MEGGPGSKRSPILTDRSADRGFYRAIGVSAAIHILLLGILFVAGDLDLRPETPELYGAGLAGGLPPSLEAQLPALGGEGVPRVDPEPPSPPKPRAAPEPPPPKDPPKELASAPRTDDGEPPDVVFPAAVTATPAPTATPTPEPTPEPTASPSPTPSPTPTPKATPPATARPRATASPSPAPTPTPTRRPPPTATPKPTPPPAPKPKPTTARTAAPVATEKPAPSRAPEKVATSSPAPAPATKDDAASENPASARKPAAGETTSAPESEARPSAPAAGTDRDRRIAEAMERVRARVGSGADEGGSRSGAGTSGGAAAGGGGVRGGTGTGGFGTGTGAGGALRGADFLLYYNDMITRIRDAWVWVGGSPNLEVEVGFRITPAGDIVDIRIVRASGDSSYDQSVLRALRTVRSLGPPPERHRETFSDVQLTFRPADLERGP